MVLSRAALVGLLLVSGACKQSLFDSDVSDTLDAGSADAAAGPLCPAPCVGDAVAEFSAKTVTGTNGHWGYLADMRADDGTVYTDLVSGVVHEEVGWVSLSIPPAGIARCSASALTTLTACTGIPDHLLVQPTEKGGTANDPALAFLVPEDGVYRLTGQFRLADGVAAGVEQDLLVSRNARRDVVRAALVAPSATPSTFDFEVEAAAGDSLLLTAIPHASGSASPLGVRFYVSTATTALPGQCEASATFDGADENGRLEDHCTGGAWSNVGTTSVPSASPRLGTARALTLDHHVHGPAPIDRSGDFTMQFWFKDQEHPNVRFESVFADHDCKTRGIWLTVSDEGGPDNWDMVIYPEADSCVNDPTTRIRWTQPVEFDAWHFYRIVRTTADDTVRVCVDGHEVGSVAVPGDADLTSQSPPYLGMGGPGGFGDTTGFIDDFRAFKRALPCETP